MRSFSSLFRSVANVSVNNSRTTVGATRISWGASSSFSALNNTGIYHSFKSQQQTRNTTILCVRKNGKVAMAGDGLVTQGNYKVKPNALKVRTIGKGKNLVMCGFAGVTADCLALLERLELKLEEYPGQLVRASVELAKNWRMDKMMRQLNATVLVANGDAVLELTGNGDCFEPHDGVVGIGSGGAFASAAARAFVESGADLSAKDIVLKSMTIASDMDTASNNRFVLEEMDWNLEKGGEDPAPQGDSEKKAANAAA